MELSLTFNRELCLRIFKRYVLPVLLIGLVVWWWHDPKADWPGCPAPDAPRQDAESLPEPFECKGHKITALANYSITGVVVSRERYRSDRGAFLVPIDIGLGWGHLSEASIINQIDFSQSGRFLYWSTSNGYPIPRREIESSCSNTHCIPATDKIKGELLSIRRHELVTLEGYLVAVAGPQYNIQSSLVRFDTGNGACEVLWVTRVSRQKLK